MNTLQDLGQIGQIKYVTQNGMEGTATVERSSGRNIGYKTRKGLLKNIKSRVNHLQSYAKANIISVKILTVAMVATAEQPISLADLP